MKAEEKPQGMKRRIREDKKREQRIGNIITTTILIVTISVSGFFIYYTFFSSSNSVLPKPTLQFMPRSPERDFKAAIVDQLSLTSPNNMFTKTAADILTEANYTVDYYGGEMVTVDFYRNLPTGGYKLIILRVHSALMDSSKPPVCLFTCQLVSRTKYVYEQLTDQLLPGQYAGEETAYFAITPSLVKNGMSPRFSSTTVVMMGCNGLTYTDMADAFVGRGAKVYVGWKYSVSATRTDEATTLLLQYLVKEKQTIRQAVENTMDAVGPDLNSNSTLRYYPHESGNYKIQN